MTNTTYQICRPILVCALCIVVIFQLSHAESNISDSFSLKLIPRDHPDSPLYPGKFTQLQRMKRIIEFSKVRSLYLLSLVSRNATLNKKVYSFPLRFTSYSYVVMVEIGVPSTTTYLLFDTASSLTWTQCEPCNNCYKQNIPIYDSQTSTTFSHIPSNHHTCSSPKSYFKRDVSGKCVYKTPYNDGSWTSGLGSFETIRVSPDRVLDNVIFGCSTDTEMDDFENSDISGIMGLKNSPISLMSQFPEITKGKFSYCFRPYYNTHPDPFYLTFGDGIPTIPLEDFHTLNFVRSLDQLNSFSYLNLIDISVGNTRVNLPPNTFQLRDDNTGGFLIDSGCLIPLLDATTGWNAYDEVMSHFQTFYDYRGRTRFQPIDEFTNTMLCYNYDPSFQDYASMTYHFEEGHDYLVKEEFIVLINEEEQHFCVTIAKGDGSSVLGSWHQQNIRHIFDINNNQLHYAYEVC